MEDVLDGDPDEVDRQREELIRQIERQLAQRHTSTPLFVVRWALV